MTWKKDVMSSRGLRINVEHDAAEVKGHFFHHPQRDDTDKDLAFQRNPVEQLFRVGYRAFYFAEIQRVKTG